MLKKLFLFLRRIPYFKAKLTSILMSSLRRKQKERIYPLASLAIFPAMDLVLELFFNTGVLFFLFLGNYSFISFIFFFLEFLCAICQFLLGFFLGRQVLFEYYVNDLQIIFQRLENYFFLINSSFQSFFNYNALFIILIFFGLSFPFFLYFFFIQGAGILDFGIHFAFSELGKLELFEEYFERVFFDDNSMHILDSQNFSRHFLNSDLKKKKEDNTEQLFIHNYLARFPAMHQGDIQRDPTVPIPVRDPLIINYAPLKYFFSFFFSFFLIFLFFFIFQFDIGFLFFGQIFGLSFFFAFFGEFDTQQQNLETIANYRRLAYKKLDNLVGAVDRAYGLSRKSQEELASTINDFRAQVAHVEKIDLTQKVSTKEEPQKTTTEGGDILFQFEKDDDSAMITGVTSFFERFKLADPFMLLSLELSSLQNMKSRVELLNFDKRSFSEFFNEKEERLGLRIPEKLAAFALSLHLNFNVKDSALVLDREAVHLVLNKQTNFISVKQDQNYNIDLDSFLSLENVLLADADSNQEAFSKAFGWQKMNKFRERERMRREAVQRNRMSRQDHDWIAIKQEQMDNFLKRKKHLFKIFRLTFHRDKDFIFIDFIIQLSSEIKVFFLKMKRIFLQKLKYYSYIILNWFFQKSLIIFKKVGVYIFFLITLFFFFLFSFLQHFGNFPFIVVLYLLRNYLKDHQIKQIEANCIQLHNYLKQKNKRLILKFQQKRAIFLNNKVWKIKSLPQLDQLWRQFKFLFFYFRLAIFRPREKARMQEMLAYLGDSEVDDAREEIKQEFSKLEQENTEGRSADLDEAEEEGELEDPSIAVEILMFKFRLFFFFLIGFIFLGIGQSLGFFQIYFDGSSFRFQNSYSQNITAISSIVLMHYFLTDTSQFSAFYDTQFSVIPFFSKEEKIAQYKYSISQLYKKQSMGGFSTLSLDHQKLILGERSESDLEEAAFNLREQETEDLTEAEEGVQDEATILYDDEDLAYLDQYRILFPDAFVEKELQFLENGTARDGTPAEFYDVPQGSFKSFIKEHPQLKKDQPIFNSDIDGFNVRSQYYHRYAYQRSLLEGYYGREEQIPFQNFGAKWKRFVKDYRTQGQPVLINEKLFRRFFIYKELERLPLSFLFKRRPFLLIQPEIVKSVDFSRSLTNYPVYSRDYFYFMVRFELKDEELSQQQQVGNFSEFLEDMGLGQVQLIKLPPEFLEYYFRFFYPFFKIDIAFLQLKFKAYLTIEIKAMQYYLDYIIVPILEFAQRCAEQLKLFLESLKEK